MTATENRAEIDHVRRLVTSGAITYEQAKERIAPILEDMNAVGRSIAEKHGKRYKPITFTGVMR